MIFNLDQIKIECIFASFNFVLMGKDKAKKKGKEKDKKKLKKAEKKASTSKKVTFTSLQPLPNCKTRCCKKYKKGNRCKRCPMYDLLKKAAA
ncbi:hypothetical protein [Ascidiimonas aurantiaca]|uniref:hypothetical protein n=1 Tax=Ascidiimonas aurantiaca TaxID=1685432 RepID=UPI0030EF68D1